MLVVRDIIFRAFDDSIVAIKNTALIQCLKGNPETDYCIAYGYTDDEAGSSFYVIGTADSQSFQFRRAACPVIARYTTVRDDPVLFHFPCSDRQLREFYAMADAFTAKRKPTSGRKAWRRYGWLDQYRLNEHCDMIRAHLKGYHTAAVMKVFAEDETALYGKIIRCDQNIPDIIPGTEARAVKNKDHLEIQI